MDRTVVPEVRKALAARVANWSVVVDFETYVTVEVAGISMFVYPAGEGARFWVYVSRGVPGHPIYPRRVWSARGSYKGQAWGRSYKRAALRLHHYNPMTRAGNVYGRPRWRQFSGYRSFIPWWPGITPRLFEENVAADLKPWYQREMENIVRRAVTAAKREGT
jgi:hypothetical protein